MTQMVDVYHTPIINLHTGELFADAKAVETWLRINGTPSAQRTQIAQGALCNTYNANKVYRRYGYPWIFQVS